MRTRRADADNVAGAESGIGGGTLYVIPVAVTGSAQAIAAASERLESELYDQGLADAAVVFELHVTLAWPSSTYV